KSLTQALYGKLHHTNMQEYNMVQKVAYILIILDGAALLLSGLVLWKPVQFSLLTILFGGYDTARYIHFLCMNIMVLFIIIHLVMVLLVPRALLSMIRGH
ncbi:cytochrome b/b6 domain-containing protein, partial [Escherichia coli]